MLKVRVTQPYSRNPCRQGPVKGLQNDVTVNSTSGGGASDKRKFRRFDVYRHCFYLR